MTTPQELFRNAGLRTPFVHGDGRDDAEVRAVHNGPTGAPYAFLSGGKWVVPARLSTLRDDYEPAHTDEWAEPEAKIAAYLQGLPLSLDRMSPELRGRANALRESITPKPAKKAEK